MSIHFDIIGIRKYMIKIYITSVTQFHGRVISNDYYKLLGIRHQRLELNRKTCENIIFSEISSLTSKTISLLIHYAM